MTKPLADGARKASPAYSAEEDERLLRICSTNRPVGEADWTRIAVSFAGRTGLALRQRHLTLRKREIGAAPRVQVRDSVGSNDAQRRVSMQPPVDPSSLPRHTSLSAAVFGDPLPGRSALDRMPPDA